MSGVYKAITAVAGELAKTGIAKSSKNQAQGYAFRGIDAIYNELAPFLSKHGLCILPRVVSRECEVRDSIKGGKIYYTVVGVEFDFVCAEDASFHTIKTYGEAMDSADKSTNKAMSAAYKYAAMQAFCIPTEGDNDADAHTHEVQTKPSVSPVRSAAPAKPVSVAPPAEFDPNKAIGKIKELLVGTGLSYPNIESHYLSMNGGVALVDLTREELGEIYREVSTGLSSGNAEGYIADVKLSSKKAA